MRFVHVKNIFFPREFQMAVLTFLFNMDVHHVFGQCVFSFELSIAISTQEFIYFFYIVQCIHVFFALTVVHEAFRAKRTFNKLFFEMCSLDVVS